ncbi:unnamed protein product [Rotaria magnacalcarata]|uniref:Uncharacterized protein n=1 Tax=Rotaria magnacalcarata TaxID=392030 RepID=A0A815DAP0_9BILA|nr:unnamed protein product [Rotaria magnacalcarata]CAF5095714.1 unnamed protein product [Rotaria magnacalcarata]
MKKKCHELNQLVNDKVDQQQKELNRIRLQMAETIDVQETTRKDLDLLASNIRELERHSRCTINTRSLLVDETFVFIKEIAEYELDLSIEEFIFLSKALDY